MDELTIYAPCYGIVDRPCRELRMSADALGVPIHVYGDKSWKGLAPAKIMDWRKELEKGHTRYAMLIDAEDTLLLAGIERIMGVYHKLTDGILLGGSRGLWPEGVAPKLRVPKSPDVPFPYPNSGVIVGPRALLCETLDAMMTCCRSKVARERLCGEWEHEDQAWWVWAIANKHVSVTIDRKAQLVFTTYRPRPGQTQGGYILSGDKALVVATKTNPCVMHFPGLAHVSHMRSVHNWMKDYARHT